MISSKNFLENHHIYNLEILSVTKNCHGDEGCPRADCINGVISVVTMVCVMYDVYSDQLNGR